MATTQEVYSLFGLKSPAQVRAERDAQFAKMLESQSGAGRAGAGIGRLLGGMFGGPSEEEQRYKDFQTLTQGQNLNDPAELRAMAEGLSNVEGWGEQAQAMRMLADKLEKEKAAGIVRDEVTVGYTEKPIVGADGVTVVGTQQVPVKDTAIYENGVLIGYTSGRDIKTNQLPSAAPPPDANGAAEPDYITNDQGVVVPNPNKQAGAGTDDQAVTPSQTVTQNVTPEAAQRISMQSGPRGGTEGSITGVAPPPKIQGEITYMNPEVLGEEIAALESQLSGMGRTASGRRELQSRINKLKAQQRKFKKQSSGGQNRRNR